MEIKWEYVLLGGIIGFLGVLYFLYFTETGIPIAPFDPIGFIFILPVQIIVPLYGVPILGELMRVHWYALLIIMWALVGVVVGILNK